MSVKVYTDEYKGFKNCVFITNGEFELVVLTEVGPRVLRYARVGGENILYEKSDTLGVTGGDKWNIFGGHRLWHSPEINGRTNIPDNSPVDYKIINNGVELYKTEPSNNISKTIRVELNASGSGVTLTHSVENTGKWPIEAAVWAITVMRPEGYLAVPLVRGDENALLPDRTVTFWPYARYSDPRLYMGENLIALRQISAPEIKKFKFGFSNTSGVAGYFAENMLFIKSHECDTEAYYPDFNCSLESYTDKGVLEIETLSPMFSVEPGETIKHVEKWSLFCGVAAPAIKDEEKVLSALRERVGK